MQRRREDITMVWDERRPIFFRDPSRVVRSAGRSSDRERRPAEWAPPSASVGAATKERDGDGQPDGKRVNEHGSQIVVRDAAEIVGFAAGFEMGESYAIPLLGLLAPKR